MMLNCVNRRCITAAAMMVRKRIFRLFYMKVL